MAMLAKFLLPAVLFVGAAVSTGPRVQRHEAILAGTVRVDAGGVRGSFSVIASPSGIVSTGTGGACLVFSPQRAGGHACHVDSDCALPRAFADGYAYCLHARPRDALGRCWLRPPGNYCLRSPTAPLPLHVDIAFPRDDAGTPQSAPALAGWWRVHACLSGRVNGSCGDVANLDKTISDGPPRKLH